MKRVAFGLFAGLFAASIVACGSDATGGRTGRQDLTGAQGGPDAGPPKPGPNNPGDPQDDPGNTEGSGGDQGDASPGGGSADAGHGGDAGAGGGDAGATDGGDAGGGTGCVLDTHSDAPSGWRDAAPMLASAPHEQPTNMVWDGRELITMSGSGETYDPATNKWTMLPTPPATARSGAYGVWSGSEALFFGGGGYAPDGAAYNPCTKTWSPIPTAPVVGRDLAVVVWSTTSHEMIVWNGMRSSTPPGYAYPGPIGVIADGAAYNPATHTWRVIAKAPTLLTAFNGAWNGTRMIVYGGGGTHGGTPSQGIALAYEPVSDTWTTLPSPDIWPRMFVSGDQEDAAPTGPGWTSFVEGYVNKCACSTRPNGFGATWDDGAKSWSTIPLPTVGGDRQQSAVWSSDGEVSFWGGYVPMVGYQGDGATYHLATGTWTALPAGGPSLGANPEYGVHAKWMKDEALVSADGGLKIYRP